MEHELTIPIVNILDHIVEVTVKKGRADLEDLKPLRELFGNFKDIKESDYIPYLDILDSYKKVNIIRNFDLGLGFYIEPKISITKDFYENGGFKQMYREQQIKSKSNSEKEILELKQLKSNVKLLERQNRYFSTNQIIAIITVVCAIIAIGFTIYTLNNPK